MRVRDLGTRPAPASLREMFSRVVRGHAPSIPVQRRQIPYWQERGWTRQGNTYTGNYQTRYAAFQGWIEQERSGHIDFYLYNPSDANPQPQPLDLLSSTAATTGTWSTWARQPQGCQLGNHHHRTT